MSKTIIVTIGREFGSGGREIGMRLSKRLGVPLYDKNLVNMAAEKLEISEDTAREVDESTLNKFLATYLISPAEYVSYMNNEEFMPPLSDQMFQVQSKIIEELADRGSCIIVGRCADYVLRERQGVISAFIHGEKVDKVRRVMEVYGLTEKKAAERMKKIDKQRENYYDRYTGGEWGNIRSHQLLINSSVLGIEKAVDVLYDLYMGEQNR